MISIEQLRDAVQDAERRVSFNPSVQNRINYVEVLKYAMLTLWYNEKARAISRDLFESTLKQHITRYGTATGIYNPPDCWKLYSYGFKYDLDSSTDLLDLVPLCEELMVLSMMAEINPENEGFNKVGLVPRMLEDKMYVIIDYLSDIEDDTSLEAIYEKIEALKYISHVRFFSLEGLDSQNEFLQFVNNLKNKVVQQLKPYLFEADWKYRYITGIERNINEKKLSKEPSAWLRW
jgi:hypothetical protein